MTHPLGATTSAPHTGVALRVWPIGLFSIPAESQSRASVWRSCVLELMEGRNPRILALIGDHFRDVAVLDFDSACAERFGKLRATLLRQGIQVPTADFMIASMALAHNLTLVTHNTADFQNIPGLRMDDWLSP